MPFIAPRSSDQAAVTGAVAGDVVPAAAHGQRQVKRAGVAHGNRHIAGIAAAGDGAREAVDPVIPGAPGGLVLGVRGGHQRALQPLSQPLQGLASQAGRRFAIFVYDHVRLA